MRKKGEQLGLFRRGGKRRGAGRKPKGERAGAPHKARPEHIERNPLHVVLRVVPEVGNLRRKDSYLAICRATEVVADREDARICQLSIQRHHIHMIVEAKDKHALSRLMQSFQVSAARRINAVVLDPAGVRRRGTVFPDRYHASPITSPKQARHTLNYVLGNWRKHREDKVGIAQTWAIDWFSSAASFTDWIEYEWADFPKQAPPTYVHLRVCPPTTWLLRAGWKRDGLLSCLDIPSKNQQPRRQRPI